MSRKNMVLGIKRTLVRILALPLDSSVSLAKLFVLSEFPFSPKYKQLITSLQSFRINDHVCKC